MNELTIHSLFSEAAYEFPESAGWMPEWFTKHKGFQQANSRIFKIFSVFGLSDFRETFEDASSLEDFKDLIIGNLSNLVREIQSKRPAMSTSPKETTLQAVRVEQVAMELLHEAMGNAVWSAPKHRLTKQVASSDKKLRIDAGTSVVKAYNSIKAHSASIGFKLSDIESTLEFRNYSNRGTFSIVFSTKPEDIAAMSSRSDWSSCQKLEVEKGLGGCVVGSTLSKFLGIIYATTGRQYEGRGEHMLARCLVRFAIDTRTNKPTLILDRMYPGFNAKYLQAMKSAFQKKTQIPVHDVNEYPAIPKTRQDEDQQYDVPEEDKGRFRIPDEDLSGVSSNEKTYHDTPQVFTGSSKIIKNPVHYLRRYVDDMDAYLGAKISNYVSQRGNVSPDRSFSVSRELSKKIIDKIMHNVVLNIAKYYEEKNKPMHEQQIRKMLDDELVKPIQKIKIKKIVAAFTASMSRYYPFLSGLDGLPGYIYDQLINIVE